MVTIAELQQLYPDKKILWANEQVKMCGEKGCYFMDADDHVLEAHRLKYHKDWSTLDGRKPAPEDLMMAMLANSPNDEVVCPFCFTAQRLRAMRTFNQSSVMLKTVKCVDCRKEMRIDSAYKARDPKELGRFVGTYKGWWFKVDHDEWLKKLKLFYKSVQVGQFWDGYGEVNQSFAERRRIEQAAREYEAEGKQR